MSVVAWRLVHDAAVVVFLGNIVTGLFWAAHARRSRDLRVVAAVFEGLTRSDSWIALPCVPVILASGVALAGRSRLPLLGTGWLVWAGISFALSGLLFALRVSPLQKSIASFARTSESHDSTAWNTFCTLYRRWARNAVLTVSAAALPLGLMVLKPSLPGVTRPAGQDSVHEAPYDYGNLGKPPSASPRAANADGPLKGLGGAFRTWLNGPLAGADSVATPTRARQLCSSTAGH